jgi:16S rRNA (guanine527-N7)-methyltransferase
VKCGQLEKTSFQSHIATPCGVIEKLDRYAKLLAEWNQKFNLVAPSTIPHIWVRHFLDSAQLVSLLPKGENQTLIDLGSGAGFPGLVLSAFAVPNIHLVESTGKKATFLQLVIDELKLDATVHNCRIEDLHGLKADIITARALAPLKDLLQLAKPLLKKSGICLFLKGQKAEAELTESKKYGMFDHTLTQSLSDPSGSILTIRNIESHAAAKPIFSRRKPK